MPKGTNYKGKGTARKSGSGKVSGGSKSSSKKGGKKK